MNFSFLSRAIICIPFVFAISAAHALAWQKECIREQIQEPAEMAFWGNPGPYSNPQNFRECNQRALNAFNNDFNSEGASRTFARCMISARKGTHDLIDSRCSDTSWGCPWSGPNGTVTMGRGLSDKECSKDAEKWVRGWMKTAKDNFKTNLKSAYDLQQARAPGKSKGKRNQLDFSPLSELD